MYGNGTMRERPPGSGRWELRVYLGRDPETNQPRQVSRAVRGGKRVATKALHELVQEVSEGRHVGPAATMGKLLDEWLTTLTRLGKARSTIESYTVHVEKHIRPALGHVRLDKLTAHDLDTYFSGLADKKGLALATIRLDHAVVSAALSQAVAWEWIKDNPARRARLRDTPTTTTAALTVDQLRKLYSTAVADDPDVGVVIALAALTGCRRGELCGLKWSDVDWKRACVKVERAWVSSTGGQHLTTTKTGKARTVFIGTVGVALLEQYQDLKRELIGHEPDGWLLSYDGGTTPMGAKTLTDYVTRLGKKLKIPVHFHTLRHFAATELVHAGVDLPTAALQMGHSPGVMASTYLHSTDERGSAAGELIADVVGKALASSQ
ncbi:MAG TPA: site-specific integrase [Acidimicrobiales bacterium]